MVAAACARFDPPENLEPVEAGQSYQAQYRTPDAERAMAGPLRSASMNAARCLPSTPGDAQPAAALEGERLTRNDLVDVRIGEDETFGGSYVISRDGALKLPFLTPIRAEGRATAEVEADIKAQLLRRDLYAEAPLTSVRVTDFAAVSVGVSGAVFEPRIVEIGRVGADEIDAARQIALGASTEGRNLSAALRAAGGVRPDADLSAVELVRGGQSYRLDLSEFFAGSTAHDVMLLNGDRVVVPSRGCFQDALMRPSPISPPGVTLFLSNLTQPATANAPSAIGREVREIPYGTRYLQAVIDANCVGGARLSSADRSAVLFTRNPVTGVSIAIERDIEDLLRRADRDDFDPYLLPNDALACYDSTVSNIAEVGRVLGIFVAGAILAK